MLMSQRDFSKGQSAIEYLTTYGWMLLVVAIVGGAIFTTVQEQSNLQSVNGFSGSAVSIDQFATTGTGQLALQISNTGNSDIRITGASIRDPDTGNTASASGGTPSDFVALGESTAVNISTVNSGDSQASYPINITYDTRELTGLQASGEISASYQIP